MALEEEIESSCDCQQTEDEEQGDFHRGLSNSKVRAFASGECVCVVLIRADCKWIAWVSL
jgi:hypothetical protein